MRFAAGTILDDKFEIVRPLGTGAMGTVYLARQTQIGRNVALKVMSEVQADKSALARFKQEATVLNQLQHLNIVTFYAYGIWQSHPYVAMEYVNGQPLERLLAESKRLGIFESLAIAKQICHALIHAHTHGIIHRDLKPANVLLTNFDGQLVPKIVDFGLAKLTPTFGEERQRLTSTGYTVGTGLYMSPEQCLGSAVDCRTDIYALGVILHECIVGKPPFSFDTWEEVMRAHLFMPPPPLDKCGVPEPIPHGLQSVINKALAKKSDSRYATVSQMLEDLTSIESGNAGNQRLLAELHQDDTLQILQQSTSRRRLPLVFIAAAILALTVVCTGLFLTASSDKTVADWALALSSASAGQTETKYKDAAELAAKFGKRTAAALLLRTASEKSVLPSDKYKLLLMAEQTDPDRSADISNIVWNGVTNDLSLPAPITFSSWTLTTSESFRNPNIAEPDELNALLDIALALKKKLCSGKNAPAGTTFRRDCDALILRLVQSHRLPEAEEICREVLGQRVKREIVDHAYVAAQMAMLGDLIFVQLQHDSDSSRRNRSYRDAAGAYRKALAIQESGGVQLQSLGRCFARIGLCDLASGRTAAAKKILQQGFDYQKSYSGLPDAALLRKNYNKELRAGAMQLPEPDRTRILAQLDQLLESADLL